MRFFLFIVLLHSAQISANCEVGPLPPGMGGPVDSALDLKTLNKWKSYRSARVEERMLEAWDPKTAQGSYKLSQADIDAGCYSIDQLIDLGRAIFLREFTLAEGLGDVDQNRYWFNRFQKKGEVSAHATSCSSCHWKGGFAGAGDRVDNAFFDGDGRTQKTHAERNPIALHGAGWVQLVAEEMSQELQSQRDKLIKSVRTKRKKTVEVSAKGVNFGTISARRIAGEIVVDYSLLDGVSDDLVVKPFGWQGRYASISEMVGWSFESHLGLKVDALEGSLREISQPQITAVTVFIATLASPIIEIPVIGGLRPDRFVPVAEPQLAPEFTTRWAKGQQLFVDIGCARCHRPSLVLTDDEFEVNSLSFSLHEVAAKPTPERADALADISLAEDSGSGRGVKRTDSSDRQAPASTRLFLFSDLKVHDMGVGKFLTRPLWGLRNSTPYSFDGSSNVIDQAVQKHLHPLSAANREAAAYLNLPHSKQSEFRIFLYSLMRSPEIRIR